MVFVGWPIGGMWPWHWFLLKDHPDGNPAWYAWLKKHENVLIFAQASVFATWFSLCLALAWCIEVDAQFAAMRCAVAIDLALACAFGLLTFGSDVVASSLLAMAIGTIPAMLMTALAKVVQYYLFENYSLEFVCALVLNVLFYGMGALSILTPENKK